MAPSPIDYREAGANANPEDMIAFTKRQRGERKALAPQKAKMAQLEVVNSDASRKRSGDSKPLPQPPSPTGSQRGKGRGKGGNKKKKDNQEPSNKFVTVAELNQLFNQTLTNFFRKEDQSVPRAAVNRRPCNSVCWRCGRKGHLIKNCRQPPNRVMCLVEANRACDQGGTHACECGECHWIDDSGNE